MAGSKGILPLLLLLLADLSLGVEEHPHRHSHNATTSAPFRPSSRRIQQQRLQQLDGLGFELQQPHQHHHHVRHEQHLREELELGEINGNRQPPPASVKEAKPFQIELEQLQLMSTGPGEQHHIRHRNRYHAAWEQRVAHHQPTTTTTPIHATSTDAPELIASNKSPNVSTRYFDRDGIYPAAWMQPRATRAPNWQQQIVDSDEDDDDDDEDDDDNDEDYEEDEDDEFANNEESLKAAAELAKQMPRYSFFSQKLPQISSNEQDYDPREDDEHTKHRNSNRHPSISAGHTKAAAKRNIFDWFYKQNKDKATTTTTTERPRIEEQNDSSNAFSNEQWNKIEHEHHLAKQLHQKELQALRDSNRNRNAPLIRNAPMEPSAIDNEVSAAKKSLEDTNDGHDADNNNKNNNNNNYARNHIPGILTEHKQKLLGTRSGVNDARRQKDEERARANKHWADVNCENSCHMPQKRYVVAGSDPSKTYTPHRTTVYLCAEDTGCCPSRSEICAPKRSEKLEMYFIVKGNKDKRSSVEVLSFVNHTECHCIERSNYNPEAGLSHNVGVQRAAILNCNCPAPFEKIFQDNGQCRCDCSSGNDGCEFLKSGREHFSLKNRRCIKQGQCKPPTCQYGEYIMRHGRCPNQQEQLPHHQQLSYNTLS